jgi:hypothetical protein
MWALLMILLLLVLLLITFVRPVPVATAAPLLPTLFQEANQAEEGPGAQHQRAVTVMGFPCHLQTEDDILRNKEGMEI